MTTATNIDIKQKLQTSSSSITKPGVTPNHPNFGEKVHLSANGTPIKTFSNILYSSIDPTIFPEARLQFNVPTVKVNYPISFNPKVSHNISLYRAGSNIPAENIPTFIYCDTVIERNFIRSLIVLTTFSQIKNGTIVSITTKGIPQFFKDFILTATDTLAHFTTNWASYVLHANKITTIISSRLIQQNTYE
jgi:hypothetical protein